MLLNPFVGTSAVGTGGVSYFFEERFEGTGYQNTWDETTGTGTMDEDYTGVVLEGAQSLRLACTTQHPRVITTFGVDQDEIWMFFKMRIIVALSAARPIVQFTQADANTCLFNLQTNNTFTLTINGLASAGSVDAMITDTTYNVWIHILKGSGSNGVSSFGFSTSGTEITSGDSYISKTNGVNTSDLHTLTLQITNNSNTNTTGEVIFDQVLISTTGTVGNNPS